MARVALLHPMQPAGPQSSVDDEMVDYRRAGFEKRNQLSRWCLNDLVLLRDAGVMIDADIFAEAFEFENRNYLSVALPCDECGAAPLKQHDLDCSHASILVLPDWYEELQRRAE